MKMEDAIVHLPFFCYDRHTLSIEHSLDKSPFYPMKKKVLTI